MKKVALTLTLLLTIAAQIVKAATIVTFVQQGGAITVSNPQPSYTLPLTLHFPAALLAGKQKIAFYKSDKVTPFTPSMLIANLHPVNQAYDFTLAADGTLAQCDNNAGNCKLDATFAIKVDNVLIDPSVVISNGAGAGNNDNNAPIDGKYGYPFYDALTISSHTIQHDAPLIKTILNAYNISTVAQLNANPFLKNVLATLYDQPGPGGLGTAFNSAATSVGDLDVTNIADGLAKFIVARMKEELSTAFFDKFKKEMETPEGQKFKILFPTTYTALQSIGSQIYNYSAYIDLLRESFQKDLALLIPNLQQLIDQTDFLNNYPEVKTVLSDALFIAEEFNGGSHPGDILNDYITTKAKAADLAKIDPNIYPTLATLNLFSQGLRSKYQQNYWISGDSIKMLLANNAAPLNIYFGLLYQRLIQMPDGDIKFNITSLKDYLTTLAADLNQLQTVYVPYLTSVVGKAKAVDTYFNSIKKAASYSKNTPDYQDYYGLVNSTTDLFKLLLNCPMPTGVAGINDAAKQRITLYLDDINGFSGIYVDLYYKQYSAAIMEIGTLFDNNVINGVLSQKTAFDAKLADAKAKLAAADADHKAAAEQVVTDAQKNVDDLKTKQKWIDLMTKYGNFIATVAKAQNSDDVQKAIEAVAMPAGSYSVKRSSVFNVALNAYIGPYIGGEKTSGFDKGYATTYGLTAPVGVAFSWGNFIFNKMSFTAFVPLVDLGALTSYRLGQGTTVSGTDTLKASTVPQVKLKDIVSPGLIFSIGIPGWPVAVSGGYQLAPTLRSITVTNSQNQVLDPNSNGLANQYASKMYSRWSVSIVVDIPILNIYTRGK